jgi:acyl-CoA thioester hydrolase
VTQHRITARVRFTDTDASGRIHFASVFRWVEEAELELFRGRGIDLADVIPYPRRAIHCEYLRMLRFDDELELIIDVERIGMSSITFQWRAEKDGVVSFRGGHTIVRVDDTGRPAPVDDHIRHALAG